MCSLASSSVLGKLPGRPIPDALIVAASLAADALPLATFDRDQRRYGVAIREP